jgi:hypothetical protein
VHWLSVHRHTYTSDLHVAAGCREYDIKLLWTVPSRFGGTDDDKSMTAPAWDAGRHFNNGKRIS